MIKKLIIFTDLDGTLLNEQYSFAHARESLQMIDRLNVPLILCSSKTRTEIIHCRKKLNNAHTFISENGGGIYVNKEFQITNFALRIKEGKDFNVIELGTSYKELRNALKELRAEGFDVKGFGDMTVDEVVQLTGLKPTDAKRAMKREFDEPFVFCGDRAGEAELKRRIKGKGFNYTKGEFFHIMGESDKGRAVHIVKKMYAGKKGKIVTAALGDSENDIEMLRNVDYPVVVKKKDGTYNRKVTGSVKGCMKADGIGPVGWNKAVMELLTKNNL